MRKLFKIDLISVKILIYIIVSFEPVHSREWDSLVNQYYPKICTKENSIGIKHSRYGNSLVPHKIFTQLDVNTCIKQSQMIFKASSEIDQQPTGENFQSKAVHLFFTTPLDKDTERAMKHSKSMLMATKILQNKMTACGQMTPNSFVAFLEARGFLTPRFFHPPVCPLLIPYRSYDGLCNNLLRPLWGAINTPFTRIAPVNYQDGLYSIAKAKSGNDLPSARTISDKIFNDIPKYSDILTSMTVLWGQFIAHDISQRIMEQCASGGIQCCSNDGISEIHKDHRPSSCCPITVPYDDSFYSHKGIRYLNFVRSVTSPSIDGSLGPAQQMNTASNFLDGSPIYSTKSEDADRLRTFQGGKLFINQNNLLPSSPYPNENCDGSITNGQCPCYHAGDGRVNQTPLLTALHTLLVREHNRIAETLQTINPHWDDERLYQESRKIVIAEIQHITYQEWIPLCIGKDYAVRHKISPVSLYSFDYDANINPGIINSFATAAFRFLHTLIPGEFWMYQTDDYQTFERYRLSDHYFNPTIMEYGNAVDAILRGTIRQPSMEADIHFSSEISKYLFKSLNNSGIDLISMDIHRGRDHGLANYNVYRSICGLKKARNFNDLHKEISKDRIHMLKSIYEHVDDIDLYVGASMERNMPGSILGPTFQCIIGEQFYRTRVGDRYFYDIADKSHSFTPDQLRQIKSISMARLICDNTNIKHIQTRVFEQINDNNPLYRCDDVNNVPKLNLNYWKEEWSF